MAGQPERAVARYYFDLQAGKPLVRDDEGADFDSLDAAVQVALVLPAWRLKSAQAGWPRGDFSDVRD